MRLALGDVDRCQGLPNVCFQLRCLENHEIENNLLLQSLLHQDGKADGRDEAVSRHWLELEDLYSKRLWHQLTLKIQTFIRHESFKTTGLFEMYECFIADFEHKINPLSLVDIAVVTSNEIKGPDEKIEFLKNIKDKVSSC
ncbi:26S proteasome non-ATPase regulatory subunit 13 [Geodia barretti]|uniref:26S proteasome non-ATPase regulatory subunit 13 n=2 Tax=Geodia barretti TaxID=519541 RepID=A0AA35XFY2_GEOBA|nr:26S proteasome non-ATPase regulatory subunit 13 [Geodia barretti]